MILLNLLTFLKAKFATLFKSLDEADFIVAKRQLEYELREKILVGDKIDKKTHLGTFFIIGETKNEDHVVIQQNLISKKEINIDEECKIEANTKYELYEGAKLIDQSYETPPIIMNFSLTDFKKINDRVFSENDIRYIIKSKLYPTTAINKLLVASRDDWAYIDKTKHTPEKILITDKLNLLNEIVKREKMKGNLIFTQIDLFNEWSNKINTQLSADELQAVEQLFLINKLDHNKKTAVIEIKQNIKTLKIIDLKNLTKNDELYNKVYDDQHNLLNKLEVVIEKCLQIK